MHYNIIIYQNMSICIKKPWIYSKVFGSVKFSKKT